MGIEFRAALVLFVILCFLSPLVSAGGTSTGNVPLNDLGTGFYQGFQGGLYPGGVNMPPAAHSTAAMAKAGQIVPRDAAGAPDPNGWIVLLSIGMSNTCHEFAVFERQEDLNSERNARVVIVNGAVGGQSAVIIADPSAAYWQTVEGRLTVLGLTPAQVQAVWLKEANQSPPDDFPGHALQLKSDLRTIVQNIHDKFPNVALCYLSTRTYGGYSFNWEPQAYENGFSVKWLIEDQINGIDPGLNYGGQPGPVQAPLLLWGPYLWADGLMPRSDGLTWLQSDFESDNVHPAPAGEQKVGNLLSQFFATESTAQPWYSGQGEVSLVAIDAEEDAYVQSANPDTNSGSSAELQVQGGASPIRSFLRFDASAVDSPVLFAKLSMRVTTNGTGGGTFSLVDDTSWNESTITANNAPSIGNALATVPFSTRDGTIAADVTNMFNADADGVVSLANADTIAGLRVYHSREANQPPRLILVRAASGPSVPAVSAWGTVLIAVIVLGFGTLLASRGLQSARTRDGAMTRRFR